MSNVVLHRVKLALALCLLPLGNSCAASLTPVERTIDAVLDTGMVNADLSLIPPEQKEAVVAKLREIARLNGDYKIGTTLVSARTADLLLLRLGDKVTIERMIRDYRRYDSLGSWGYDTDSFEYSRQPLLIPYLAGDFDATEDVHKVLTIKESPGDDGIVVGAPVRSIFSAILVTRIIRDSPVFGPEMKVWAKGAMELRSESPERFRILMRVWWEANKAAFVREDYWAVVPVAEQVAPLATQPHSTLNPLTPQSQPIPSPTPRPTVPLPFSARSIQPNWGYWPWFLGMSLAVSIWLFWRCCK